MGCVDVVPVISMMSNHLCSKDWSGLLACQPFHKNEDLHDTIAHACHTVLAFRMVLPNNPDGSGPGA